jgi:hypothetical protein
LSDSTRENVPKLNKLSTRFARIVMYHDTGCMTEEEKAKRRNTYGKKASL